MHRYYSSASAIATYLLFQSSQEFMFIAEDDRCRTFVNSSTPVATRGWWSHRSLSEPYLDVALHDALLHLLIQIPSHMPCTYSSLVLLSSTHNIYRVQNIHIRQQFSVKSKFIRTNIKIITLVWLQADAYAQNALFVKGLAPFI